MTPLIASDPLQRGQARQEKIGAAANPDELRKAAGMPAIRRRAGSRKAICELRWSCNRGGWKRLTIAQQRILLTREGGELRAGDPSALHEFELPRDVGIEADKVDAALLRVRRGKG